MSAPGPLFELRGVAKRFRRGDVSVSAVDGVDLDIAAGELVALEGPSGSGKTTLLQLLGALDRCDGGRTLFEGRDLAELSDSDLAHLRLRAFGFVFQQFNLIPTLSALENVESVLAPAGVRGDDLRARAHDLLEEVGLAPRAEHLPSHLSGGEQQRVAIARAVAKRPSLLLCDEPTGALDFKTGILVLDVIERVNCELGTATAIITHNAPIADIADRVVTLGDGRIQRESRPDRRARARDLRW